MLWRSRRPTNPFAFIPHAHTPGPERTVRLACPEHGDLSVIGPLLKLELNVPAGPTSEMVLALQSFRRSGRREWRNASTELLTADFPVTRTEREIEEFLADHSIEARYSYECRQSTYGHLESRPCSSGNAGILIARSECQMVLTHIERCYEVLAPDFINEKVTESRDLLDSDDFVLHRSFGLPE